MGPSSSTTLNAIFRYGVGQLNNADSSIAGGMRVDVVAVPEPTAYALALAGLACGGFSMFRRVPPADPDLTPTSQRDSSARGKLSATKRGAVCDAD